MFDLFNKKGNVELAEEIFELLPYGEYTKEIKDRKIKNIVKDCITRQDTLNKVIEVCGNPDTPRKRHLYATVYAWSNKDYRQKAIYYIELYLNNGFNENLLNFGDSKLSDEEKIKSHTAEMYRYLGIAYEKEYMLNKALEVYTKCMQLKPEYESSYISISNVLIKQHKLDDALKLYKEAKQTEYYSEEQFKNTIDRYVEELEKKIQKGYAYKPRKK